MDYYDYLKKMLFTLFHQEDEQGEAALFVRGYNGLCISEKDMRLLMDEHDTDALFYHTFTRQNISAPYEPFLDAIYYYYHSYYESELSVEEFADQCGIYELQKEIFISYLTDHTAKRSELIIPSEVEYEKKRFMHSIINCYRFLSKQHHLILVFHELQYASLSTIHLLKEWMDTFASQRVRLVLFYDEAKLPSAYCEQAFSGMINTAEEKNQMIDWENMASEERVESFAGFLPEGAGFREYLNRLRNLYHTLALEDLEYYIGVLHDSLQEDKIEVERILMFEFYELAAQCYLLIEDVNSAIFMSEKLSDLYDKKKDLRSDYRYHYVCGTIQMIRSNTENGIRYARRCQRLAQQMNDENAAFLADVLYEGVQFSGWRNIFAVDFDRIRIDKGMIEKLRKNNFRNTLAHYLVYGYDNDADSIEQMAEGNESQTYREAMHIIIEIDNTELLLSLYTKYIVLFSNKGYYKYVDSFYEAKLKIITKEKNLLRQANLYMGLGYNNIVKERYAEANEKLLEAVQILYEIKKPEGIMECLYNMSVNFICAGNFQYCQTYMQLLFKMLQNLGLETIQICSLPKLYALRAISHYMLGNDYRFYRSFNNMKQIIKRFSNKKDLELSGYHLQSEEWFLYELLNAILEKNNGNFEEAKKAFMRAEEIFRQCSGTLFYVLPLFIREYYDFDMKIGNTEHAQEILDYGIEYCRENDYYEKYKYLSAIAGNKNVVEKNALNVLEHRQMENVLQLAYQVGRDHQLYVQRKNIRFLAFWQALLDRNSISGKTLVEEAMNTLQDNFNLEDMAYMELSGEKADLLYSNITFRGADYQALADFVIAARQEFLSGRNEKNYVKYEPMLKYFGEKDVFCLIGVPVYEEKGIAAVFAGSANIHDRCLMSQDDLVIIKTAIIQLNRALERIRDRENIVRINTRLNELAVTDLLTGLYNRQGLEHMMEENADCTDTLAILYVDLDHFKYYNDTFGHDVGDVVLKEFSRVFLDVTRDQGYVVRYGGDEFLIILNHTGVDGAKEVAENIYDRIRDGFAGQLNAYVGRPIRIPKEMQISCSIGIVESEDGAIEHVETALKRADEALYYMKRQGKGGYMVWNGM